MQFSSCTKGLLPQTPSGPKRSNWNLRRVALPADPKKLQKTITSSAFQTQRPLRLHSDCNKNLGSHGRFIWIWSPRLAELLGAAALCEDTWRGVRDVTRGVDIPLMLSPKIRFGLIEQLALALVRQRRPDQPFFRLLKLMFFGGIPHDFRSPAMPSCSLIGKLFLRPGRPRAPSLQLEGPVRFNRRSMDEIPTYLPVISPSSLCFKSSTNCLTVCNM